MIPAEAIVAETNLLRAHRASRSKFGSTHKLTRICVAKLALLYQAWGKPDKAAALAAKGEPPPK